MKGDPKVIHSGPSSLGAADRMAKALGWFSIGLGLTELIAAERIARALGITHPSLLVNLRRTGGHDLAARLYRKAA